VINLFSGDLVIAKCPFVNRAAIFLVISAASGRKLRKGIKSRIRIRYQQL
jgi:hypothetical protein